MIGSLIGNAIGAPFLTEGQQDAVGASASVATATGVGATTHAGIAASAGVAADAFVGATTHAGVGSSVGVATVAFVGTGVIGGVGAAAGVATCDGIGEQEGVGVAVAAGIATVIGIGTDASGLTISTDIIQKPVDYWLPASQTGTQGRATPGSIRELTRAQRRHIFNE